MSATTISGSIIILGTFLFICLIVFLTFDNHVETLGKCMKYFKVLNKEDAEKASDVLCELDSRIIKFIKYIKQKYVNDKKMQEKIGRLESNYHSSDLHESEAETFTINKGEKIMLCIRNPHTGKFFSINTLMFVVLHEITHMMLRDYHTGDHPMEYWKLNDIVLRDAEEAGVYQNIDYRYHPVEYCNGIIINNNPRFSLS